VIDHRSVTVSRAKTSAWMLEAELLPRLRIMYTTQSAYLHQSFLCVAGRFAVLLLLLGGVGLYEVKVLQDVCSPLAYIVFWRTN